MPRIYKTCTNTVQVKPSEKDKKLPPSEKEEKSKRTVKEECSGDEKSPLP